MRVQEVRMCIFALWNDRAFRRRQDGILKAAAGFGCFVIFCSPCFLLTEFRP